jgi:hypothetical protein
VQQAFPYHRTMAPLLWAFVALAVGEALLVHLFVALRWPTIGWPLLALSTASIVWLVRWILSFRRYPHVLCEHELQLRIGSLRHLAVPVSSIDSVCTSWPSGDHRGKGAINLVPVAYPNRMLRLNSAIRTRRGLCDRIALRVDDPASFDAAMAALGIAVGSAARPDTGARAHG